ncbi:MAG TPA: RNA polymerase sigma factor [Solirubrobacterales bacterium]|jgi:DNA-directed RNA polymerase specialized sigma24 family protein
MAIAALPEAIEEWTQEQRDSLLVIAERTLAGYGKYSFSREFIARHVDDFVQDALLQAWVSQRDPEAEALRVHNPAGFVSFKVVQLALDKAKGEKVRLDRAAPEGIGADEQGSFQTAAERISDPIHTDEVHELVEQLQATKLAMAQLPERQRAAFVKCQLEGHSQTEVAKELSATTGQKVSRKAVERLVANARISLSVAFSKVASGAFCEEQRWLLKRVEAGLATPEQAREAHSHLEDCSQCVQVRAFARFERNAGLAAISLPGFGFDGSDPTTASVGLIGSLQHFAGAIGERARDLATRAWPFGGGVEAGGTAVGTVTTTKAIVAICVAAGGTGACTKMLSPAPHNTKPTKPPIYRQQSQVRQGPAPVAYSAQPSESVSSPSPKAGKRPEWGGRAKPKSHTTGPASRRASSSASTPSNQAAHREFGFEGAPSPTAGTGGGSPGATPSAVDHSAVVVASGSAPISPSPIGASSRGASTNPTPTASSGGGGSSSTSQAPQEFGLSP